MKHAFQRSSATPAQSTAPASFDLATLLSRARAMTAKMSAKPVAKAPSNTQHRVAAPKTGTGTGRRVLSRTGSN